MVDGEETGSGASRELGLFRLGIGLLQGLLLYALYRAGDSHVWPAAEPMLFAPLALIFFFVPLLAIQGAGGMRARTLGLWCAGAGVVLALLGAYDRWREWLEPLSSASGVPESDLPSFALFLFAAAGLFIAHCLIAADDDARKWIAPYENYFDAAWKLGVQLVLAVVFVGVFWGVLELGAAMFDLIGLKFLSHTIEKAWFAIPATALTLAAAIHLIDLRDRLVAGIRTVALVLLSWLLPLMALLAAGFLTSLLFTGLEPLWQTHRAAALLLSSAAILVILINAAWQNGPNKQTPPLLVRIGGSVAALALAPLAILAAYALALRVGQHGWTANRINAAACLAVAACYALGYAATALRNLVRGGGWLAGIAPVNIATGFVVLGVLLALFSPIADPMRIAVASQIGRLKSGTVPAEAFDYQYLRFSAGRFGREALVDLAANAGGPEAALIRNRARAALAASRRSRFGAPTPEDIAAQVTVYPKDHLLPQSLLRQNWSKTKGLSIPPCLTARDAKCEAFFADMDGDGRDEIIFTFGGDQGWKGFVLGQVAPGRWGLVGSLSWPHCQAALAAMRAGQYAIVAPDPPRWRALEAGGSRFRVDPIASLQPCP